MLKLVISTAIILLGATGAGYAQQFHASDSWEKVRVGGKICFAEHEHYGESPLWVSKRGAKAARPRSCPHGG